MKIKTVRNAGFTLIEIMIVVAIIGILATIAIPNFVKARLSAQQKTCISNLASIDGAKNVWATENKASLNTVPTIANIQPYMGHGSAGTAPTCPADPANSFGTSYSINDLNNVPTCLILPGAPGDATGHHMQ